MTQNIKDEEIAIGKNLDIDKSKIITLSNSIETCLNIIPDSLQPIEIGPSECRINISQSELTKTNETSTMGPNKLENVTDNYEYLNSKLNKLAIPEPVKLITEARELELSNPNAYLNPSVQATQESRSCEHEIESIMPSAPMCEEQLRPQVRYQEEKVHEVKQKLQCMSIEEAVNMFGGTEMAAVKMMSELEEAIVEAGPISGPEHPLVDLLSTFK